MKTLSVIAASALLGAGLGVAIGYARVSAPAADFDIPSFSSIGPGKNTAVAAAVIDEPVYNFGTMQRGAKRRHMFLFRNEGDAPLVLTAGETTCKCTSFEVTPKPIAPGEVGEVGLEWVARSYPGEFRQNAVVNTNDPLRSSISLSVEGTVVEPAGMEPSSFSFGELRSGESGAASVLYYSNDVDHFEIDAKAPGADSENPHFALEVLPVDPGELPQGGKSGYRLNLTAKPGLPLGEIMEWVAIKSSLPDSDALEVPVFGRVVGDITVHGDRWNDALGVLNLGMVERTEGVKKQLILSVKGPHASETRFRALGVDPPELKVEIGETVRKRDDVYHTDFTVEVPKGTRPMIHLNNAQGDDGVIRLGTTHPESPEIKVNVRFAVVQ
ncbi:MAG: DUF1573 domain-containing protein [Planctomycetales bacterium]|nr:DUF1573 domain-containing protein [Planctomycetales bacterium]